MKPLDDVTGKKRLFSGLEEAPVCRTYQNPHWQMEFSEADNKGVSVIEGTFSVFTISQRAVRLCLHKHNLCQLSSQSDGLLKGTGRYADLCKWGCHGVCGGETVVTGRGMRLKRAMGSGRTFSTHNALWCLFTHRGGFWVVRGKASHLLSLFCKAFHGHCGV